MPKVRPRELLMEANAIETKPGWWQLEFLTGEMLHVEEAVYRFLFIEVEAPKPRVGVPEV